MKKDHFHHKKFENKKRRLKWNCAELMNAHIHKKTLCQFYPLLNCLMLTKQFAGRVDLSIKLQTLKVC